MSVRRGDYEIQKFLNSKIKNSELKEKIDEIIVLGRLLDYRISVVDFVESVSLEFRHQDLRFIYRDFFCSDTQLENLINFETIESLRRELASSN